MLQLMRGLEIVKDGKNLVCTSSSKPNRELENLKRRRKKQRDNREVEGQGHIQDPAPGQGQDHVPDPDPGRGRDLETERKEGQEVDQGHLLLRREVAGGKVEGEAGQGQSHLYLIKGAASHPLHHHGDEKCPGAQLQLTNLLGWEHNQLPTPSWVTTTKATKC